jgi:ankyrin repeat protein
MNGESITLFQSWLLDLDIENYAATISGTKLSLLVLDSSRFRQFGLVLLSAIYARPLKIRLYARFLGSVLQSVPPTYPVADLKSFFIKEVFAYECSRKSRICFLFRCYEEGIFKLSDVTVLISKAAIHILSEQFASDPLLCFCWFAPEINLFDQTLFNISVQFMHSLDQQSQLDTELKYFISHLHQLRRDNWSLLRKLRDGIFGSNQIAELIRDDDLDVFIEFALGRDLKFTYPVQTSLYDIHWIMSESPSIFDLSCYFGAVHIFKHLFGSHEEEIRKTQATQTYNCVHFAISGGNPEIVRILANARFDFHGALHVAALFHQNDIFDWLLSGKYVDRTELFGPFEEVIHNAAFSFNLYAIHVCQTNDFDIGPPLLFFAVRECNIEIVEYLINEFKFDLRIRHTNRTPLGVAIQKGDLELVKFLVEREPGAINIRSASSFVVIGVCGFVIGSLFGLQRNWRMWKLCISCIIFRVSQKIHKRNCQQRIWPDTYRSSSGSLQTHSNMHGCNTSAKIRVGIQKQPMSRVRRRAKSVQHNCFL